jgi:hypothetical protein
MVVWPLITAFGKIGLAPHGIPLWDRLSVFSDEAFPLYLPAYLIADLDRLLEQTASVFHLCHCLEDSARDERINPRCYGEQTPLGYHNQRPHGLHGFFVFD